MVTENTSEKTNISEPSHYVGIGASAGGLEAIDLFFKHMPVDTGCAFILIQHLSPDYKSLMVELLAKNTDMPVHRAEEGMLVEANQVYLIPPNHDLRIFHGRLLLNEQHRHSGINLPIDIFLNSLAEDQGDKSVAIILSGTGSDGTRGVRAIKEKIGMVMVQDDQSAAFDGMPRSALATGLVDYVLSPQDMPEQLISYIQHPYANKSETADVLLTEEDSINRVFAYLREKTGVDFTYYKPSTMLRRIERRMSVNQILTLRDYLNYLESYSAEIDALQKDLLIGVTNFFRDPEVFETLQSNWLSGLIKRNKDNPIRIWVPGCSTGEEAYTLAMLCKEVMRDVGSHSEIKIFATDVDKNAITRAGQGVYPESISADVPSAFLAKYFKREDKDFVITRQIREMVVFAQHNVIKDPPFTNIELVSCRNLLIYLQPVLQKQVMELFNFSLNSDGILVLGTSETIGDSSEYFESLHNKWKIYRSLGRQRRDVLSDAAANFNSANRFIKTSGVMRTAYGYRNRFVEDEKVQERLLQSVGERYLPFSMVVNEQMELLHMNGKAEMFLRFPVGQMVTDVTKLARKDLAIPLATGLQKVIKTQVALDYTNIHLRDEADTHVIVNMHICVLPQTKTQHMLLGVFIEEPATNKIAESGDTEKYDIGKEVEQRIVDLEQELQFTRESLQATVEELETSNEELQATNEELLASNEELQSTNEELQSVNEELYTVNAEHQNKITELTEVNNDLDNLMSSTGVATLFLDNKLDIRRFTPDLTAIVHIINQDIGRPFTHVNHDLVDVDLVALVKQVNGSKELYEQEVHDQAGNDYLLRIFPYQMGPDFYSGLLLTFVNINSIIKVRKELLKSEEIATMAEDTVAYGSWYWDVKTDKLDWSASVCSLFGLKQGEFEGTYDAFLKLLPEKDREDLDAEVQLCLKEPTRPYQKKHRVQLPDGSIRWLLENGKVQVDSKGKPDRMLGIVQDITPMHQAEEALKRSEKLFHSMLDNLNMAALQLDTKGRVLYVNPFLEKLLGKSLNELTGQSWIEQTIPEKHQEKANEVLASFADMGLPLVDNFYSVIKCKDGNEVSVFWNNTAVYDEDNSVIGISAIGQI